MPSVYSHLTKRIVTTLSDFPSNTKVKVCPYGPSNMSSAIYEVRDANTNAIVQITNLGTLWGTVYNPPLFGLPSLKNKPTLTVGNLINDITGQFYKYQTFTKGTPVYVAFEDRGVLLITNSNHVIGYYYKTPPKVYPAPTINDLTNIIDDKHLFLLKLHV